MQVPQPGRPVGQPLDTSRSRTPSPTRARDRTRPARDHPLIADDLLEALLAHRPQRQMIIQQPAQQLPPVDGQDAPQARRATGRRRPSRPGSRSATRTAPGSRQTQSPATAGELRAAHLPLQHRYQPARQAGLHRPRRKVRHNGCRDRRSRWPPPWSTLDMSNADFDTRHMSPGTRPTSRETRGKRPKTPAIGRPNSSTPGNRPAGDPKTATRTRGDSPQNPVSTGDSLSVQPAPRVPSEEPHPAAADSSAVGLEVVPLVVEIHSGGGPECHGYTVRAAMSSSVV